ESELLAEMALPRRVDVHVHLVGAELADVLAVLLREHPGDVAAAGDAGPELAVGERLGPPEVGAVEDLPQAAGELVVAGGPRSHHVAGAEGQQAEPPG